MDQFTLNLLFVGASFALYIGIAIWARAGSTSEFYAAGRGVHPVTNGMATAADWMSAASFISMAGLIAFTGYDHNSKRFCNSGNYEKQRDVGYDERGKKHKSTLFDTFIKRFICKPWVALDC